MFHGRCKGKRKVWGVVSGMERSRCGAVVDVRGGYLQGCHDTSFFMEIDVHMTLCSSKH